MLGKIKNQHYIPQMYLNRFIDGENKLTVWNMSKDIILQGQSARNYASIRYYYDSTKEELKKSLSETFRVYPELKEELNEFDCQLIEHGLGRVEADFAGVLRKIDVNDDTIYNAEVRNIIVIFLHLLSYRTESFRMQMDNINEVTKQHLLKMNVDINKVENMGESGKSNQLYQLLGIRPLLKSANMLIENYNWYIGIVKGEMKLIISDDVAKNIRLGFNDICIPISADKGIIFRTIDETAPLISKDEPEGNIINLSERSVFAYNAMQLSHTNRFMFGNKYSLEFLRKINKNHYSKNGKG